MSREETVALGKEEMEMLGNEGRESRQPHYAFIGRNRCPMRIFRVKLDGTSWTRWSIGIVSIQHVTTFVLSVFSRLDNNSLVPPRLPLSVPPHLYIFFPRILRPFPRSPSPRSDLNSSTSFKSIAF